MLDRTKKAVTLSMLGGEPWAELGQELLVRLTLGSSAWVGSINKGKQKGRSGGLRKVS